MELLEDRDAEGLRVSTEIGEWLNVLENDESMEMLLLFDGTCTWYKLLSFPTLLFLEFGEFFECFNFKIR